MLLSASSPLLALAFAGTVLGGPLVKRQTSVPSVIPTSTALVTSITPGGATANVTSAVSSVSSAISSIVSAAATNTTIAPAPTGTSPTSSNSSSSSNVTTGCPTGYSLTYVLGTNTYPAISIANAYGALLNWTTAIPPPIQLVNTSGSGVGANRTWIFNNLTATEQLTAQTLNASAGFIDQVWVSTRPLNVTRSLIISNYSSDLTLFANSTNNNLTTVQFFVNFCASSQADGLSFFSQLASGYLTGLNALFLNSSSSGTSSTPPISSAASSASSASSAVSSAITSPSSVVSGAASSGISGASGVLSTAISGVTGVGATVTSGGAGALTTAVSAVSGGVSTAISGAASVASVIAGPFTS